MMTIIIINYTDSNHNIIIIISNTSILYPAYYE